MVSVNEYRKDLARRLLEKRRDADQKRLEIEEKRKDAIESWRREVEETEKKLFAALTQREDSIMNDDNLSDEEKQIAKKFYNEAYLSKIQQARDKFDKIFDEKHKEIEENDIEAYSFLSREQDSWEYEAARKAHRAERDSNFRVRKLQQSVDVAQEELEGKQDIVREKKENKHAIEIKKKDVERKQENQKAIIENLTEQLEAAKDKLRHLEWTKEEISRELTEAISAEVLAEQVEKEYKNKKAEVVKERDSAEKVVERITKENNEWDLDLLVIKEELEWLDLLKPDTIKKIVKCLWKEWKVIPMSHLDSRFEWDDRWIIAKSKFINILSDYGREVFEDKKTKTKTVSYLAPKSTQDNLLDDKAVLLKELTEIGNLKYAWRKIHRYLWIYEKIWYVIKDKEALSAQLHAAYDYHPSILNDIKKDLTKRIQDPVNNKPEKKKWSSETFFVIDLYCDGLNWRIILAEDKKTILCAAPHIPYERILRWEIRNLTQVFDWKK